jgi:hypothetical protein
MTEWTELGMSGVLHGITSLRLCESWNLRNYSPAFAAPVIGQLP